MKTPLVFCFAILCLILDAQPNCELLKSNKDCYASCKSAMKAIRYHQGSYKSQQLFNESIELCPTFSYSYMEKGVPYLKRGLFVQWKNLIDKAVELSPIDYLGYRGWCRLQFLRDYRGAIADIEKLKSLINYDVGHCQTGQYHLDIALALCYKELGQLEKAKKIFLIRKNAVDYTPDLYNDYHYGIIEYELGNFKEAISAFHKQLENNEIAEAHFYLALVYKKLEQLETARTHIAIAKKLYLLDKTMYDNYAENIDKIFLADILTEEKNL